MLDKLDQQIKRDDEAAATRRRQRIQHAMVVLAGLFGALYAAIRFMES